MRTLLVTDCEKSTIDLVGRHSNIYVDFDEQSVDNFEVVFHDVPAPWPLVPEIDDDTGLLSRREQRDEVGYWGLYENKKLLRDVLTWKSVDWYSADAVLIPSKSAWDCSAFTSELEILSRGASGWLENVVKTHIKLTDAFGWCGVDWGYEGGEWWLMFEEKFADKVFEYYRGLGKIGNNSVKLITTKDNNIYIEW